MLKDAFLALWDSLFLPRCQSHDWEADGLTEALAPVKGYYRHCTCGTVTPDDT